MTDLLTPREVAAELRVSEKTLANWRYLGIGPKYLKGGRITYRRADVDAYRVSLQRLAG